MTAKNPLKTLACRSVRHLFLAGLLIVGSAAAHAATVTFTGVANSVNRGGVYTGFYGLQLDAETILGLCDARFSQVGSTWTADIRSYADIQAGAVGKFNSPSTPASLAKYSQAGWLFSQIGTLAPTDYAGQADIQEAIWKIMAPGYTLVGSGASSWFTAATSGLYDGFNWSNVMRVVTTNPLIQNSIDLQEFLVGPGITVVPVPAAAWLFGSALGVLALGRRRRS